MLYCFVMSVVNTNALHQWCTEVPHEKSVRESHMQNFQDRYHCMTCLHAWEWMKKTLWRAPGPGQHLCTDLTFPVSNILCQN